jgi:hypothetical protein
MDFFTKCLGRKPKPIRLFSNDDEDSKQAAQSFVNTLFAAEKNGPELHQALNDIIQTASLKQYFARVVFETLQKAIETARPMGLALGETYKKVCHEIDGIEGFVKDHPIMCAVIAIGILVVLAPWVIEALGFVEGGILEGEWTSSGQSMSCDEFDTMLTLETGSFAASWQSRYAGFVPKGSLFSLLQRLGMKGFVRGPHA